MIVQMLKHKPLRASCLRLFATNNNDPYHLSNADLINKEFASQEEELFSKLSKKEQDYKQVERLTMLQMQKNNFEDQKAWWNKLQTMSQAEMKLLPYGFLKKYGSYIHFVKRME